MDDNSLTSCSNSLLTKYLPRGDRNVVFIDGSASAILHLLYFTRSSSVAVVVAIVFSTVNECNRGSIHGGGRKNCNPRRFGRLDCLLVLDT